MHRSILTAAVAFASVAFAPSASAQLFSFSYNFDGVPGGTLASTVITPLVSVNPAIFAPDTDEFGEDIPGTERWRIDPNAPATPISNIGAFAPSGTNALGDALSPILLSVVGPQASFISFASDLDNDPFGSIFNEEILFLNSAGQSVFTVPVNQTQVPGQSVNVASLASGVTSIVLPTGAYYDNVRFTVSVAPEVGTLPLALLGLGAVTGVAIRRRRSN